MSSKSPPSDEEPEGDASTAHDRLYDLREEHAPDDAFEPIVWSWDLDAEELWWGPAFEEHFGWDPATLPPVPDTWFDRIHPDERDRVVAGIEEAIEERRPVWFDSYRLRRADGSYAPVRDRAHLVVDDGEPVRLAGGMTDLSEIHEAQEELRRRVRQQSLFADLAGQAIATRDLADVFELATVVLEDGLDVACSAVLRHRPERSDFLIEAETGWTHLEAGKTTIPDGEGSQSGYTLAQRGTIILEDTEEETRFEILDPLHEHGVRSGMTVPIRTSQGTWGVLAAHHTSPRSFDEDDIALLDSVAAVLGAAIERERARDRFELAAEATGDVLWEYEITTDALWFSPMVEKVFGWKPSDFETFDDWADRVHPDDLDETVAGIDRWLEEGERTWEDEYRLRRSDGAWARVHNRASIVHNEDGDPIRAVGSIADRTEEIEAQERLRLQARMLSEIGQAVIATDADGTINYWNDAAEEIYGWTEEEAMGQNVMELTVPDSEADVAAEIMASLARGEGWTGEFDVQRKDGSTFPAIIADSPILDEQGELAGVIGVATDVTELKETERALTESRDRLDHLLREAPTVILTADAEPPWGVTWMCPNISHVLGQPSEAFEADPALWWSKIPEDDLEEIQAHLSDLSAGDKVSVEHRWEDGDEPRWLRSEIRRVDKPPSTNGEVTSDGELVVSAIDVTARVETEAELAESEQRFRQMAENIDSVFWLSMPDLDEILYVSPAYEEIWGRPVESLYEDPTAGLDAVHPEDRDRVIEEIAGQPDGTYDTEFRVVQPDGEIRWVHDRAFPVHDEEGDIVRIAGIADDVTDQKKLEAALREREERIRFTVENTPTILFSIDPDGVFTLSQGAGLQRLDLEPGEAVGRHYRDIYEDYPDVLSFVDRGFAGERVRETLHVEDTWFDVELIPRRDDEGQLLAVDGIALDVTKRVEAERGREEEAEKFRLLAETVDEAFWIVDAENQTVEYLSPGHEDLWGIPLDLSFTDPGAAMEVVHPDDRERLREAFETGAIVEMAEGIDYRVQHPEKGLRHMRTTGSLVERSGQQHIVGTTRDVTEEKEAQRAREQRIMAEAEIERLEAVNEAKTDFLNASAHELSNPMTPMRLQIQALSSGMLGDLNEDQQKSVDLVDRNLRRLDRLVGDLLDASRLQQDRISIDPAPTDLADVVAEVADTVRPQARGKGVDLSVDRAQRVEATVDRDRIAQVLHNLLDNAVKFTPEGGTVTVSHVREDDEAVVTVRDTGIGMTQAQLDELFGAFHRVHEDEHDLAGTGLGLYISRGLVEKHGGTIEVESDGPGEGSTFTVLLPIGDDLQGDAEDNAGDRS